VADFATEIIKIKAQLICNYEAETIIKISNAYDIPEVYQELEQAKAQIQQQQQQMLQQRQQQEQMMMAQGYMQPLPPIPQPTQPTSKKLEAAIKLIKDDVLRQFSITVSSDSLVNIDEQAEKQSRIEF